MRRLGGLSTFQLMLLSTGGMIGAGWLFSPYYGFKIAGSGVAISWLIVAVMTFIIGLSFAEVSTRLPIVGGISRYVSITHRQPVAFIFLMIGWLSYVVYLPLEIQSCVQYLGFWFVDLVNNKINNSTTLSPLGLVLSLVIMLLLTWFNTLAVKQVAKANSLISIWKILVPFAIAWILIIGFGDWHNVKMLTQTHKISVEDIFLAITQGGLAFAFTGFQNSLILANNAKNPQKSLPYSIFTPIVVGFFLYCSLSLAFIFCIGSNKFSAGASAPLLALVGLFGIHILFMVLFLDAVVAPLGTANVYTAVTARILLGLTKDFLPKSILQRLNKNQSPAYCLCFNALVGAGFLLPFPTWMQLVDFLSSLVVFAYIAGPIALLVLRPIANAAPTFKVWNYKLVANLGFIFCSLLIYWSGLNNLFYLMISLIIILLVYSKVIEHKSNLINLARTTLMLLVYVGGILLVAYLHKNTLVLFPYDNLLIVVFALVMCRVFAASALGVSQINANIHKYDLENASLNTD
jgi:amino acid transporter